jgi:membrane protease YdiL (CAAX protease family)
VTTATTNESRERARKGLLIYFGVLVPSSALLEWLLIRAGDSIRNHLGLVLALMWTPTLASIVARFLLKEGAGDISFRFGGRTGLRMTLIAWFYPLAVGALAYGLAWASGLAAFKSPTVPGLPAVNAPLAAFSTLVAIRLTIGVPIAAIAAAGEEFGWRGYMLTRLIEAGVPNPLLLSGAVWASWHLPLILGGVYASGLYPAASAGLFFITIPAQALLLARVRLTSGSIWPAIVGHSAWNATIQGVFDFSTAPDPTALWVGESGVLVAVASVVLAWVLVRGTWPRYRAPGAPIVTAAA